MSLQKTENHIVTLLRIILGVVFVWLGLLDLAGFSPTLPSYGGAVSSLFMFGGVSLVGLVEVGIGILLLVNHFRWLAEVLLSLYLLMICGEIIANFDGVFTEQFPRLTGFGELMIKNMTLATAGILTMIHEKKLHS